MKNMFKKSLVAVALASIGATATAAEIEVTGGALSVAAGASSTVTVSNEWLEVNESLVLGDAAGLVNEDNYRGITVLTITLGDQYSVDDRVFLEFDSEDAYVSGLPLSITSDDNALTLGRTNVQRADGVTIVTYRVAQVTEGASTIGSAFVFDDNNLVFDAAAVRDNGGLTLSYRAEYKNNGGRFDQDGDLDVHPIFVVGNQLDGSYNNANLTARIATFDSAVADSLGARRTFVADSGIGRTLTNNVDTDTFDFENAATVTSDTVSNTFVFEFSEYADDVEWDIGLIKSDINTTVALNGDFSWFVGANPLTGVPVAVNGGNLTPGTNWDVVAVDGTCSVPAGVTAPVTEETILFSCQQDTDFNLDLSVNGLTWAAGVLPRQDFTKDLTMTYTGTLAGAEGTKSLELAGGTWTNDGYSVFVPYMPYGRAAGISQMIFITNTGPTTRQLAVDVYPQNHGGVSFEDTQPLNVVVDIEPGINRVTGRIYDALFDAGFLGNAGNSSRTFAFDFIISGAEDEIEVYTGYNVNNDRNYVPNTSNRSDDVASDFRRTGAANN